MYSAISSLAFQFDNSFNNRLIFCFILFENRHGLLLLNFHENPGRLLYHQVVVHLHIFMSFFIYLLGSFFLMCSVLLPLVRFLANIETGILNAVTYHQ